MPRYKDITNQKFGRLTAQKYLGGGYWQCLCDCGKLTKSSTSNLIHNKHRSCGCYRNEVTSKRRKTHGLRGTTEYYTWASMIFRCFNKNSKFYKYYGGRGITVCEKWRKFENFLSDMGKKPTGMSLDRIDNNKNYSPENCRWATHLEQMNNRNISLKFTYNGEEKTVAEWAVIYKIKPNTLYHRLFKGLWNAKDAFEKPVRFRSKKLPRNHCKVGG